MTKVETVNETSLFEKYWREYEHGIQAVVGRRCREGYVGIEFDDLMSVSRQVLLKSIRTFSEKRGSMAAYFFSSLRNRLCDEYMKYFHRCGEKPRVKRYEKSQIGSMGWTASDLLAKQHRERIFSGKCRCRRIPSIIMDSLDYKLKQNEENDGDVLSVIPDKEAEVKSSDPFMFLVRDIRKLIHDRRDRKILLLVFKGVRLNKIATEVGVKYIQVVTGRLEAMRPILSRLVDKERLQEVA